jgi:CRISPR/Cas system CSM-associated protein Csm3 (group 7 of RAMP superfamily)
MPPRDTHKENSYTQEQLESKSMVDFNPLNKGTRFNLKIRYHNLRPIELGALLSAITYHNNHQILRHNLGMAKSMGYGHVKLNLKLEKERLDNYLKAFEKEMDLHTTKYLGGKWTDSEQIKNLGSLAKACTDFTRLNFPGLEIETWNPTKKKKEKKNEFNEIKQMFDFLKAPSEYPGNYFQIKSIL